MPTVHEDGTRVGVILPIGDYHKLLDDLEELESIRAYDSAKSSGDEAIPFEQSVEEIDTAELREAESRERGRARARPFFARGNIGFFSSRAKYRECTSMRSAETARPSIGSSRTSNLRGTTVYHAQLKEVERIIEEHYDEITRAWDSHFGG